MMLFGKKNQKAVAGEPNSAPSKTAREHAARKRGGDSIVDVTAVPREDGKKND